MYREVIREFSTEKVRGELRQRLSYFLLLVTTNGCVGITSASTEGRSPPEYTYGRKGKREEGKSRHPTVSHALTSSVPTLKSSRRPSSSRSAARRERFIECSSTGREARSAVTDVTLSFLTLC